MTKNQEKYLESVPEIKRNSVRKAYAGVASPRQAIKAKCMECVNYEDIHERVGGCKAERCPLFAYRPFQKGAAHDPSDHK